MISMFRVLTVAVVAALALGGCARNLGGDVVDASEVGAPLATERGVVESVRRVQTVEGETLQDNPFGFGVGALAGGLGGSMVGGGKGKILATGAGAVAGGLLGAATQREVSSGTALEYVVKLPYDRRLTIVQADASPIPPGSPVYLITGRNQRARIAPIG